LAKGNTKSKAQATDKDNTTNKMEAMRQALQDLGCGAKPAQLKDHI
jgi:hypothetical protein